MNKYSFSTGALYPLNTADALSRIKKAGFDNAELMPQAFYDMTEKSMLEIDKIGITVSSIHYPLAMFGMLYTSQKDMMQDGIRFSRDLLNFGARFGTKYIVVHPHSPAPFGYEDLLEKPVVENLLHLADMCREKEIVLAMENSPKTCATAKQLLNYISELAHPNIKPVVDTTEACEAGEDPISFLRTARPCHLHLSDFADDRKHLPIGEGAIDWQSVRAALESFGYSGYYTVEPAFKFYLDDIDAKLKKSFAFISRLFGE